MKNFEEMTEREISDALVRDRIVYSVKRILEAQETLATLRSGQNHIPGGNPISDLKLAKAKVSFNYHRNELGKLLKQRETSLSLV